MYITSSTKLFYLILITVFDALFKSGHERLNILLEEYEINSFGYPNFPWTISWATDFGKLSPPAMFDSLYNLTSSIKHQWAQYSLSLLIKVDALHEAHSEDSHIPLWIYPTRMIPVCHTQQQNHFEFLVSCLPLVCKNLIVLWLLWSDVPFASVQF